MLVPGYPLRRRSALNVQLGAPGRNAFRGSSDGVGRFGKLGGRHFAIPDGVREAPATVYFVGNPALQRTTRCASLLENAAGRLFPEESRS